MKVILNAKKMTEREDAHEYLKYMLDFPGYYGKNLDALYDCLTDLRDLTLVIINSDSGGYFEKLLPVMKDACKVIML